MGSATLLILLDSAAFYTINHGVFLDCFWGWEVPTSDCSPTSTVVSQYCLRGIAALHLDHGPKSSSFFHFVPSAFNTYVKQLQIQALMQPICK